MSGLLIGYARVSTDAQDLTAQRDALTALGVPAERLYVDRGLTGTRLDRPGLREALAACRTGDTLVVTKLDRLARSLPDARDLVDDLTQREVKLNLGGSLHDPTDPVGRVLFNVLAMVAEFEADLIRARTREGMRVAKANGRLRGKQPKLTPRQEAHSSHYIGPAGTRAPSSLSCSRLRARRSTGRSSAPSTKRRRPTPLRPLSLHLRGDPAESPAPDRALSPKLVTSVGENTARGRTPRRTHWARCRGPVEENGVFSTRRHGAHAEPPTQAAASNSTSIARRSGPGP